MKVRHDRRGTGLHRLLAAILSIAVIEVLRQLSPLSEAFTGHARLQAPLVPRRAGKDPFGEAPFGNKPQDTQEMFKEMQKMFGQLGQEGGPQNGAGSMENPFAAMFGANAAQPPKKTSDMWFLNKFPVLKRIKRPVLIGFFAFCFYRGWVGRWGFVFGCMAGSYFDMLAVPLRVSDRSPFTGRAYVMTQIYVDYFFKLIGYIINVGKGKAKFPPDFSKMFTPPTAAGAGANPFAPGANPFAAGGKGENPFDMMNAFDVSPVDQYTTPPVQPTDMPTAPTVGSPPRSTVPAPPTAMAPLTVEQVTEEKKSPPTRSRPPVVDADVTFLD